MATESGHKMGLGRLPDRGTAELLRRHPVRALLIGITLAAIAGAFAYAGGFLTPRRLSASHFTDALEVSAGGPHEGFRRAHAKGICIAGSFLGAPAGRALSAAAVFGGLPVPVTGRFAEAAADPFANDAATLPIRSMALRLQPSGAAEWRMAINDTPGLHVSTPQAFFENVIASTPDPLTGKPDPAKMKAFLDRHPETVAFFARMSARPLASGFANDSFNSIDGFIFVAPDGMRRLVRWSMRAEEPFATLSADERSSRPKNYLFDDLLVRVGRGPIKWRMIATIANPGDPNEAAEIWPEDRRQVDMGELTIVHVESEAAGNCQDLNFDPLILPPGVEPSDDPIPFARSAVYAASFRRRSGETKPPSAVANQSAGAYP
jgi:catalase